MSGRRDESTSSGVGCLLFIGLGLATVGGCLLWGPTILLVSGGIIIALAVAAGVMK